MAITEHKLVGGVTHRDIWNIHQKRSYFRKTRSPIRSLRGWVDTSTFVGTEPGAARSPFRAFLEYGVWSIEVTHPGISKFHYSLGSPIGAEFGQTERTHNPESKTNTNQSIDYNHVLKCLQRSHRKDSKGAGKGFCRQWMRHVKGKTHWLQMFSWCFGGEQCISNLGTSFPAGVGCIQKEKIRRNEDTTTSGPPPFTSKMEQRGENGA